MSRGMSLREAALSVVRQLREHGHEALWAGGCVRDMLLGREPSDYDVATNAVPERIIALFPKTRKVGVQFGVVLVRQGRHWIETATFRTDDAYLDGRRPESVTFTTAEHDAQRRDFTINGLFYDPLEDRVLDYVGGQQDLSARILRAIGDPPRRFGEDYLRMLRAVRFATRFDCVIEPATADAIRNQAAMIARISAERIHQELAKMLAHPTRARALELIAELKLLEHLWPDAVWTAESLARAIGVLQRLPTRSDFVLALAAMLHDRTPHEVRRIAGDLRCSNQQTDDLLWLVRHQDDPQQATDMSLAAFKRLAMHQRFEDLLTLSEAKLESADEALLLIDAARRRLATLSPDQIKPAPLVTGEDLITSGLRPGPRFKQLLDVLYEEQLNELLTDRPQALVRLQTLLGIT